MNLRNKKRLIARTLNVGVERIAIDSSMAKEIKEAITRQDIRDLEKQGVIRIKEISGRKKKKNRKTRRGQGSRRKKVNVRKKIYVIITRKLRRYINSLREKGEISRQDYIELRKKIKTRAFRDLLHLKEHIGEMKK